MTNEHEHVPAALPCAALPADPIRPATPGELFGRWLGSLKSSTRAAYLADLRAFAAWLPAVRGFEHVAPEPVEAVGAMIRAGEELAEGVADAWRSSLLERGLASATINRRLAALRSVCAKLRIPGVPRLRLSVAGVRSRAYKDVRGPGADGVRAMLRAIADRPVSSRRARDLALVRLLADCGLRRFEALGLDLEHVDGGRLLVRGKGSATEADRVPVTLPETTRAALEAWLAVRPASSTTRALFLGLEGPQAGERLSGSTAWRVVRDAARDAGLDRPVWPHALRHSAITTAAESGKASHELRRYSRHASLNVLELYLDARHDTAGDLARFVAARHGSVVLA